MQRRTLLRWLPISLLTLTVAGTAGCINGLANILYAIKGEKIDPPYPHLKGKKVAIVCGGENGLSNDTNSMLLTRYVEERLSENVKDIQVIPQTKVDKWLTEVGRDEPDFEAIGKGVGADQVVAITLTNLSLKNGQTLFKGKADISVTVYDISKGGTIAFRKSFPEFEFPKMDGPSIVDTTEGKFRVSFLTIVSQHIGVLFYPFDPKELAVQDPISMRL